MGLPHLNDLAVGSLSGDDAYYLGRAIRTRDILFNFGNGKYDYFVVLDEYGQTSYLNVLSAIQIVFGPTPFSMRLLNAVFFVAGAVAALSCGATGIWSNGGLHRAGAGAVSSIADVELDFASQGVTLFFQLCTVALLRGPHRPCAAAGEVDSIRRARGLRRLAACGSPAGFIDAARERTRRRDRHPGRRGHAGAPADRDGARHFRRHPAVDTAVDPARAAASIESLARIHGGHVFTVGHPYKLLDDEFYKIPAAPGGWDLYLTPPQAGRFVVRAAASFLVTPWPWQLSSLGELALLPEQLVWYLLLIGLPAGFVAGWRRDAMTTSLFIGYVLPTAVALALTNGNIGTLMRLRGLVTPYLMWVGVLGIIAMTDAALRQWRSRHPIR